MRWRNLLFLALVVGGLAFLTQRRLSEESAGVGTSPDVRPLLPALATDRVTTIRIDSLARAVQVRLECDRSGNWFLTDPVAYPAEEGVARAILRTLASATVTSAVGVRESEASLSPPVAVLDVVQADPEGERRFRIAIGGVDLDPNRVFVRVSDSGGAEAEPAAGVEVTTRALANLLERNPDDYRSRRTTSMLGQDVIALRREGRAFVADRGGDTDLTLDAEVGEGGWRTRGDRIVTLDPNAIGLLATGAATLRVDRFREDEPVDLGPYGLEDPAFTIRLLSRNGTDETLAFGHAPMVGPRNAAPETWYCRRMGLSNVFEVDADDVALLIRPAEDFYDAFLVRAKRESIERVEFRIGDGGLTLSRSESSRSGSRANPWTVAGVVTETGGGRGALFPADSGPVEDVLAALETTQLEYPEGAQFRPLEPPRTLTITTRRGLRFGGRIGQPARDPKLGVEGSLFLRFGDTVPALLDRAVVELFDLDGADFRSERIHRLRPEDLRSVHLTRGDEVLLYRHPNEKDWFVGATRFVAPKPFRDSLFTLLALRAERWLEPDELPILSDPLEVSLETSPGIPALSFTLGLDEQGRLICIEGEVAAVVDAEQLERQRVTWGEGLVPALWGLFSP